MQKNSTTGKEYFGKTEKLGARWSSGLSSCLRRRNFTIIELLIVISIIAILAGMLLPALNSAQRKAKSISCSGKLKTLTLSMQMYTLDNNGFYPHSRQADLNAIPRYARFQDTLMAYVGMRTPQYNDRYFIRDKDDKIIRPYPPFACPARTETGGEHRYRHYGMNYRMNFKRDTEVKLPTERFLIGDVDQGVLSSPTADNPAAISDPAHFDFIRHGNLTAKMGFVDGHVEGRRKDRIPYYTKPPFWND